jgi:hypothetical protein
MREWLGPDHAVVRKLLAKDSPDSLAASLVDGSKLADPAVRLALWNGGSAAIAASDESLIDQAVATWKALPSSARDAFDVLQVHGYEGASGDRSLLYALASAGGKRIRNSEHGEGDGSGASLAAQIALDFNVMHVTAFNYWQATGGSARAAGTCVREEERDG